MVFRREPPPPPPRPAWLVRFHQVQALIQRHDPEPLVVHRVEGIEEALHQAAKDRAMIRAALTELDPDRIGADLKRELRRRPNAGSDDTPRIVALRRRYESVAELRNRDDDLGRRIDTALADLEAYAASVVESAVRTDRVPGADHHLECLRADAEALRAAHAEIERMTPEELR